MAFANNLLRLSKSGFISMNQTRNMCQDAIHLLLEQLYGVSVPTLYFDIKTALSSLLRHIWALPPLCFLQNLQVLSVQVRMFQFSVEKLPGVHLPTYGVNVVEELSE